MLSIAVFSPVLVALSGLAALLALGLGFSVGGRLRRALKLGVALALAFVLGAGRAWLTHVPALPAEISGRQVVLLGEVVDDPVSRRGSTRLVVQVVELASTIRAPRDLRVETSVYVSRPVDYGDSVVLAGELDPPDRYLNFDARAYLAGQGIAGVLRSPRLLDVRKGSGDPIHGAIFGLRHALVAATDRALPEPLAALVLGVVFGYRAALPPLLEQQMIASGLIHIVVISGLKVSLLARITERSLGRFWPRAAAPVALLAMVVYALLAGASAAALRAALMGALVVLASLLKRDSHVYTSMALTAALLLAIKPELATDVSFQLSFAGTLGITSMTDGIAARLHFLPGLLRDPFAATLAAEAATWPLMLADFHQVSLVGPLANALVLPLLPAIIVIGGAGAVLGSLNGSAGWPLLQAGGAIAAWFRFVIERSAGLPLANLTAPFFPAGWLAAASILNGSGLLGWRLLRLRKFRRLWGALAVGAAALSALVLLRPDGRLHIYALDVGTGSAVLIRTGEGRQVLINGGADPERLNQALGEALPPTARSLWAWVITGGRRTDIGAAASVLDRFQVGQVAVWDPVPWTPSLLGVLRRAQSNGIPVFDGLPPLSVDGVGIATSGDGRVLIESGSAAACVMPPTGSSACPPDQAVIMTSGGPQGWPGPVPRIAIIQVTPLSRDGLPSRRLMRDLQGAQVLRTDRLGTVELVVEHASVVAAR